MTRDQALQKIKKCLALGRSAETHEAAAALRQAQKLMQEHQVTERDLSLADVVEVEVKATSSAANLWEVALASIVADAFGCEKFARNTGAYNAAGNFVRSRFRVFVGIGAAPSVAAYAYEVLSRQCARARLAHIAKQPKNCKAITKTARGDEFAKGWVLAAAGLVERFANPERDEALLLTYMEQRHPDLKTTKVRDTTKRRKVEGHLQAGFRAGEQARLDRGVGAVAPAGLLQ